MNKEEQLQQLKTQIAVVYAEREKLKQQIENKQIKFHYGLKQLETIDIALSELDTQFKHLWDNVQKRSI